MTKVNCLLTTCLKNISCICTAEEITLDAEHYCCGGCDEGWEWPKEDEEGVRNEKNS